MPWKRNVWKTKNKFGKNKSRYINSIEGLGDKVEIFLSSIQMIKWKKWGSYYRNNIRNFCIVQGYDLETENVNQVASKMNGKNAHKSYIIVNFQNSRNKYPKSFQEENFFEKNIFSKNCWSQYHQTPHKSNL